VETIWTDTVLQKIRNFDQIPVNSTISRILKTTSQKIAVEVRMLLHKLGEKVWDKIFPISYLLNAAIGSLTIDFDSTVKTVYGKQEGAEVGYKPGKKGKSSYHPLLATCYETQDIIQGNLRPGDCHTSNNTVGFMNELFGRLDNGFEVYFRADSGFFSGDILNMLDEHNSQYIIKVNLKHMKKVLEVQEWQKSKEHPKYDECSFDYQFNSWNCFRHFSALRIEKPRDEIVNKAIFLTVLNTIISVM
jgi:hypothetical protein